MRQATELEFLQYFYDKVDNALGPASDEIYDSIKQDFIEDFNCTLPKGYGNDD